jgi:hypothetical protein
MVNTFIDSLPSFTVVLSNFNAVILYSPLSENISTLYSISISSLIAIKNFGFVSEIFFIKNTFLI